MDSLEGSRRTLDFQGRDVRHRVRVGMRRRDRHDERNIRVDVEEGNGAVVGYKYIAENVRNYVVSLVKAVKVYNKPYHLSKLLGTSFA